MAAIFQAFSDTFSLMKIYKFRLRFHRRWFSYSLLIHWGRVTHICVSKLSSIGSDNGLSPGWRRAFIWTNAGILLIGPFGKSQPKFVYLTIRFNLQIVFVYLYITQSRYHHCTNFIWRHWTYKMPVRYDLSSVWVRLSISSQLSIIQHLGLCVFSLPISFVMIERIYMLCLIIIIKSDELWSVNYYPLFRIRSWNNGMRCISLYILNKRNISYGCAGFHQIHVCEEYRRDSRSRNAPWF